MKCQNCGNENETSSRFCTKCGKEIINSEQTSTVQQPKGKSKLPIVLAIVIPILIAATILLIVLLTSNKGDEKDKKDKSPDTTEKQKKNEKKSTKKQTTTNNNWEISYTVPEELQVEEKLSTDSIKYYQYNKGNVMCSFNAWKIEYIEKNATAEDMIVKYSYSPDVTTNDVEDVKVNGKTWKYLEYGTYTSEYTYGMFSSDKESYYLLSFTDYSVKQGSCKKYFDEVINSIKYNKNK